MAYDAVDHEIVLFGGVDNSFGVLQDTWIYNASGWHQLFGAGAPPARYLASMTYDAKDGYVVLFGGAGAGWGVYSDTWAFAHGKWTPLQPSVSPRARFSAGIAYDAKDGYVVMFGGYPNTDVWTSAVALRDTWKFVGGQWTNISKPFAPVGRGEAAMVYDAADGYVLLYGGSTYADVADRGGVLNDTWTFVGGRWSELHPATNPSVARVAWLSAAAFDAKDGYVLLFSGAYGGPFVRTTWSYVRGQWAQVRTVTSPPSRDLAAVAYDPDLGSVILLDGCAGENLDCPVGVVGLTNPGNALQDQWMFSGGRWTASRLPAQPGYDYSASMVYDPRLGYVLFYDGPGQTWKFGGGHWNHLSLLSGPRVNSFMAMTYDARDGYVVFFGGTTISEGENEWSDGLGSVFLNETWKFESGQWTQLHPAVAPAGRAGASMAYDPGDGYVVLFGGGNANGTFSGTWKFVGGQWTKLTPTLHPRARSTAAMAYDAADGYLVIFGGCASSVSCTIVGGSVLNDTWTFAHGQWAPVHPALSPSARAETGMAYDGPGVYHGRPAGGIVLFGGTVGFDFGIQGDTWFFLHGQWSPLRLPFPPPSRFGEALAFNAADGRILMAGGQSATTLENDGDLAVNLNDTWEFVVTH